MREERIFTNTCQNIILCIALASIAWSVMAGEWHLGLRIGIADAQENWRTEFDAVCSRTQDAMVIPSDELKRLVDRCDRLKPQIEKLDESQKKVYLKRLQLCRDLYSFVLESREKKP